MVMLSMRTYRDAIALECELYAQDPKARFIGYNTAMGSRMYGTLKNVPVEQCIEAPVAENLMVGLAMGMSLEGYKPVVCFERHDFIPIALDAIVNHVDKMPAISGGQFRFPIIFRCIIGAKGPLNAGPQHTQDYSEALWSMVHNTPVVNVHSYPTVHGAWDLIKTSTSGAIILIEHRDLYDQPTKILTE